MININFMSWNTQLYEYGNKNNKSENDGLNIYNNVASIVKQHVCASNSDGEIRIAVLQEIPYKIKDSQSSRWRNHVIFEKLQNDFKLSEYDVLFFKKAFHIKMTIVIATKGTIEEVHKGQNNIYVPFIISPLNLNILALHAHDAFEAREWLFKNSGFIPKIMLGDFNAGNYKKTVRDNEIAVNRQNYLLLTEGYIDICQGQYTTKYKTHIDHALLENSNEFIEKYQYQDVFVDRSIKLSDHYPIYFKLSCIEDCAK